jgi:hypothetical protein
VVILPLKFWLPHIVFFVLSSLFLQAVDCPGGGRMRWHLSVFERQIAAELAAAGDRQRQLVGYPRVQHRRWPCGSLLSVVRVIQLRGPLLQHSGTVPFNCKCYRFRIRIFFV